MKNTLGGSGSPYLHQHAHQPVAWQRWGRDVHELARQLDRPLFISIGYATCHWCHVMAHESFDDEDVAALLNTHFVPVKIDREERPDVDQFYMTACQASGRRGGWPLTVIALPDGRPFYVATYLPRNARPPQAGLVDLLQRVAALWNTRRAHVDQAAGQLFTVLEELAPPGGVQDKAGTEHSWRTVRAMTRELGQIFDDAYGGFGSAPKFPSWHHLGFLLRTDARGRELAERSLVAMRAGGIWDHVGGGIHRYSTDSAWRLPHFEKMLYDQAWALRTYAEAHAVTGNPFFATVTDELMVSLQRDFRSADGLYFTAWDADSEGEEGRYYTWTWDELGKLLGEAGRTRLAAVYDLAEDGNFLDEATRQPTGRNLLCARDAEGMPAVSNELEVLFEARCKRVPPLCDTKRLADMNGLLLSALALTARYTGSVEARDAAHRLGQATWMTFMADGSLHRSSSKGSTLFAGQLDDYAFLAEGYIHLAEISGRVDDLDRARTLLGEARDRLLDPDTGHWYVSFENDVPLRMTRYHDEAYPCGASVLLRCMEIMGRLQVDDGWSHAANSLRGQLLSRAASYPLASTGTGAVLVESLAERGEITVLADRGHPLADAAGRLFAPHLFVAHGSTVHRVSRPASADSSPRVQICTGSVCHAPIHRKELLKDWTLSVYSNPPTQSDRS
ncbi:MAG: thioredoxin domain-containing protein [Bacteroidetes bacterium CG12_big_fil_rev_8_21_14_0_65_60_17]|nr:MAG: thioredoxin domain-containing protein [Bacteroidetes bacterium CG12_big_fil_rev_8_21_14_0_65_60_17]